MKRLLTIAIIGLILTSCKKEIVKTDYTINGNAEGIYNGIRVYLKAIDYKTLREQVIDTAIVMNEKFSFTGKVDNPEYTILTIDNIGGKLPFIIENNTININIKKANIGASKITGSKTNDAYVDYVKSVEIFKEDNYKTIDAYRNAYRTTNNKLKDSLYAVIEKNKQKTTQFPIEFAENNSDNYLSLILIEQQVNDKTTNIEDFKKAFEDLDSDIKNSPKGVKLSAKINELYQISLRTKKLEIGKKAPNFEAPTPDGKMVALNDIKGKVTIIDFWAAWCGPCRRENPNVVRVYNQYHNDGLEIIGVSLDGTPRQKNPKQIWLDAIEKDQLTWTHVSNLKYFRDPVAQLYNISAIPATYILDKGGRIAAKNLRGKALELKVKDLLGK